MAQPDPRDPLWVPAPLEPELPRGPIRIALFRRPAAAEADAGVIAALEQTGRWLEAAGFRVEEAEPPHFDEAAELWRTLVMGNERRTGIPTIEACGDEALKTNMRFMLQGMGETDRDGYLDGLSRRHAIARAWSLFLDEFPVLLLPVSWRKPVPVDDDIVSAVHLEALVRAQSPLLATALLGLPGLSVPTGLVEGLPMGVQLVSSRFREDLCLLAGEVIEKAAGRLSPPDAEIHGDDPMGGQAVRVAHAAYAGIS